MAPAVIHLFSHVAAHTTARYFERAGKGPNGDEIKYWDSAPDLSTLAAEDLFVFVDPAPDWPLGIESLQCPSAAYFIDVHMDLQSRLQCSRFFDAVFVAQKDYLPRFSQIGHRQPHWLPLACDPTLYPSTTEPREFEVGFVGNLGRSGSARHLILTSVLPRYRANDYAVFHPPREMAQVYGRSKIVLNASVNGDLNMRVFEALASGALLLTDRIDNGLSDLFEDGRHYVGYSSVQEAVQKIDHFLACDAERCRIAEAGQRLAVEQHTYQHRWSKILLLARQSTGQAPARRYSGQQLGELYADVFASMRRPRAILSLLRRFGLTPNTARSFLRACGRWLNARVPLTPGALRARFLNR